MKGLVFKAVGGTFWLRADGEVYVTAARKKNRLGGNKIIVGDLVEFNASEKIIEKVFVRKNMLLRPVVANVDAMFIFLTTRPEADFVLVDKLLIHCYMQNINPVLIISKLDIISEIFFKKTKEQYHFIEVYGISSYTKKGIKEIEELLQGRITCFAGQSATGKTSLINLLDLSSVRETGELSERANRGRHTTRHNELIVLNDNTYVIDTAGFSLFEDAAIKSFDLCLFYPDFQEFSSRCKYHMCTHSTEPECAVRRAVEEMKLNGERYSRYLDIFNELRVLEKNMY